MAAFRVPNHVHHRTVHDEVVLLDARTDRYLALNATGATIWSALVDGDGEEDAVRRLTDRFAVSDGEALADVKALIAELLETGLIVPVDGEC